MKKTIKLLVEIDVADLPRVKLRDEAREQGCKPSELPGAAAVDAHFMAEAIDAALVDRYGDHSETIWSGSGIWARVTAVRAKPATA